jgi:hypothetical protein
LGIFYIFDEGQVCVTKVEFRLFVVLAVVHEQIIQTLLVQDQKKKVRESQCGSRMVNVSVVYGRESQICAFGIGSHVIRVEEKDQIAKT